jgi:hypothetical protein
MMKAGKDMPFHSVRYRFCQSFKVSAREAYDWCTDYSPRDMALMQEENATREVKRVSEETIILTDTYHSEGGESTTKQKLVCLYPDRLTWTSTHVTGPNRCSQFLYEITPETDRTCRLKFTGLFLDYNIKKRGDKKETDLLIKKLEKMDSEKWKLLAKEMENELKQS